MHFYDRGGKSQHTIIGKNGKERTTSIADARKLLYVPSTTTIMDCVAKPALIMWLQNELLAAASSNPYNGQSAVADWNKLMLAQMRNKSETAAKKGTDVHAALDLYFTDGIVDKGHKKYIKDAIALIEHEFPKQEFYSETSFCHKFGFGGCVDLHSKDVVIDFKTKEKKDLKDFVQYDEHRMQLASYQMGLKLPNKTRRYNLFISVHKDTSGMCKLIECTNYNKYIDMFLSLLKFWQLRNNYDSSY